MPFFGSIEGATAWGRPFVTTANAPGPDPGPTPGPSSNAPGYYTSVSDFLMYFPGFTATTADLKATSSISSATGAVRTYTSFTGAGWNVPHDKDLDSNVWYSLPSGGPFTLRRYALTKGGTTVTTSTIYTYVGPAQLLGQAYAPACMWNSTLGYGAMIAGGYQQSNVHVLEFTSNKLSIRSTYTVSWANEIYGVEVVPRAGSGFTYDYGVAYTRQGKMMASWTVDFDTKSWTNIRSTTYSSGITGPANGDGMIYYPIGKPIFKNDPHTSTNRIGMNDTSTSNLYVWNITESTTSLAWTWLKNVPMANNGGYPYHMSISTYQSIA